VARLFVNRLTVIDASSLHPQRGLLGESWIVDIELAGTLDSQGMVLDFSEVKRQVKALIDREFDHRLLVPADYPGCRLQQSADECRIEFTLESGAILRHRSPAEAIATIPVETIDGDSLARSIAQRLHPLLPTNVEQLTLQLRQEEIDGASYRYSHGLRKHQGNCQRIAHGHRSAIRIERNGCRDRELEQQWATRWHDIYIASRDDLQRRFDENAVAMLAFAYQAPQGRFELELPAERCQLIDTESTVENLARYIAEQLKAAHPESRFRVQAFEGVDKGAIAER